eukprot:gnl/TRDRNA2_/TRDRNA2_203617_c0_seq1.p1 gnl/TRDRNA2_/TRDRNA2_203617_c0~~gnl/TRDRNA2_/TRDRNA2_203617_c0_seq1.p1  ORF type:complete len:166 (+),score=24.55 gnl/TRDRNA2_/TRDRNA2_203617_c0_seq1:121-618(+)
MPGRYAPATTVCADYADEATDSDDENGLAAGGPAAERHAEEQQAAISFDNTPELRGAIYMLAVCNLLLIAVALAVRSLPERLRRPRAMVTVADVFLAIGFTVGTLVCACWLCISPHGRRLKGSVKAFADPREVRIQDGNGGPRYTSLIAPTPMRQPLDVGVSVLW